MKHKTIFYLLTFCIFIVELRGGWGPYEGLLYIYHDGEWGNVDAYRFNDIDATVACRSFGYSSGEVFENAWYDPGTGVIWMSSVQCSGDESSLAECEHSGWGCQSCSHLHDVAAICGKYFTTHVKKYVNDSHVVVFASIRSWAPFH